MIANDHRAVGDLGLAVELPAAEVVPEATSRMFCKAKSAAAQIVVKWVCQPNRLVLQVLVLPIDTLGYTPAADFPILLAYNPGNEAGFHQKPQPDTQIPLPRPPQWAGQ